MTPQEAALHAAVQDAFNYMVSGEYKRIRGEAETVFRDARRREGTSQLDVLLPDGTPIGRISIKGGGTAETVNDPALLKWAAERNREAIEDYVPPAAFSDAAVIACLKEHFPELVRSRLRPATRDAYLSEARRAGGWLEDKTDGKKVHVLKSEQLPPSGDFAFTDRKSKERRAAIMAALRKGDPVIRKIAFGTLLALPAAAAGDGDG